eukprot:5262654-Amphidinium_carterae.1
MAQHVLTTLVVFHILAWPILVSCGAFLHCYGTPLKSLVTPTPLLPRDMEANTAQTMTTTRKSSLVTKDFGLSQGEYILDNTRMTATTAKQKNRFEVQETYFPTNRGQPDAGTAEHAGTTGSLWELQHQVNEDCTASPGSSTTTLTQPACLAPTQKGPPLEEVTMASAPSTQVFTTSTKSRTMRASFSYSTTTSLLSPWLTKVIAPSTTWLTS